jgi:heptosyltransferase-2
LSILRTCSLTQPHKIMVRSTNWIGDAVMGLPALEALRERFPGAEIVVVSKPWMSEVYKSHPAVNRQIVYDAEGEHAGRRGFSKLIHRLQEENFDGAILFQNAFHAAWMAWRARIPVRLGYARDGRSALLTDAIEAPPPAAYGHQSYYYLHLLFRAGLIEQPEAPRPLTQTWLSVDNAERAWARRELDSLGLHGPRFLVGIAPGAAFGPAKRWPAERFAALADRLVTALNADVLIFGSRSERSLADEIARQMEHTPSVLAGETTLRQSMALLECCRLVVTNDSGLMHLASALGLPVAATFGSTDERATGPLGPNARIVKHRVACSPCGLRTCPIDFRCMEGLSVASVYRATLEMVKQLGITHDRPAQKKGPR